MKTPKVLEGFPASGIRKMAQLSTKYKDVIFLAFGEPDFDTPAHVKEAAKKALDENLTHYSSNIGAIEFREAVVEKYKREMGLEIKPENVIGTIGGMESLFLAFLSNFNPGDEVLVTDPYYSNYLTQLHVLGLKPVLVPLYEKNQFRLQAEDVEKAVTPKTRALVLNSPCNPTGGVIDYDTMSKIVKVVREHDLMVISDEVYESILYDGAMHVSPAQFPEIRNNVIIVNSLSKTYAMTGWRIGYAVASEEIINNMCCLQQAVTDCIPTFIQHAAAEALTGSQEATLDMLKQYTCRRDIVVDGLNEIPGISCSKTAGAFYAFPNISALGKTSEEFAIDLLDKEQVVTVPGSYFGKMGEGFIRISFATSEDNLKEAVRRIGRYVEKYCTVNA